MTRDEAVEYIENAKWSASRPGLSRTEELLARLGDPQDSLRFIHVAGSNGKGSTCAMLDSVLREAGYKSGMYTSPYLERFEEHIRYDGNDITGEQLGYVTEAVRAEAEKMEDHPSRFEMLTAAAMLFFARMKADPVVLEVGMGGALDSTNAINTPEVAVITNITLEHTEYLGDTIKAIAETKCGIIKPGCAVVAYDGLPEVTETVRTKCEDCGDSLTVASKSLAEPVRGDVYGQTFLWKGREYSISLAGVHQMYNSAVVLEVIDVLRGRGWDIPEDAVKHGLAEAKWPARFEVLAEEPLVILDGAHNPQCTEALAKAVAELLPGRKAAFLAGILADKDYERMAETIAPLACGCVCVTPPSLRALPAEELAACMTEKGVRAETGESLKKGIRKGLSMAADSSGVLVMMGSLYLAGELRAAFGAVYRRWLRSRKIKARDSLTDKARAEYSERICEAIARTEEYKAAQRILAYKWTRGEVKLDRLEEIASADGKELVYPLCISDTEMSAVKPGEGPGAWKEGFCGILEPDAELGTIVLPEDIDLVICPCSSFDENCNRMGMGGGYYDRYLPGCVKADKIAVAFETQKSVRIPVEEHDVAVGSVITEKACYNSERQ